MEPEMNAAVTGLDTPKPADAPDRLSDPDALEYAPQASEEVPETTFGMCEVLADGSNLDPQKVLAVLADGSNSDPQKVLAVLADGNNLDPQKVLAVLADGSNLDPQKILTVLADGSNSDPVEVSQNGQDADPAGLHKALRDTKAWATRLSQDNAVLRKALEAAITNPPPELLSDPGVESRFTRTREALSPFDEFAPLLDLLDTVIHGIGNYEREAARHALVHAVVVQHPDALELRADENFLSWVERQPALVRAALQHSQDPEEVGWAIGLYKREKDGDAAKLARLEADLNRRARMQHAASPSPQTGSRPGANRFSRADIARMSLEDYRANETAINDAITRGEIS